jgi:hypothetical protein
MKLHAIQQIGLKLFALPSPSDGYIFKKSCCSFYYMLHLPKRQATSAGKLQIKAAKILPFANIARSKQDPIKNGMVLIIYTGPRQPGPTSWKYPLIMVPCMRNHRCEGPELLAWLTAKGRLLSPAQKPKPDQNCS